MKRTCLALLAMLALIGAPSTSASPADVPDNRDFVAQLYRDLLARLPGTDDLERLVGLIEGGSTRGDIASLVLTSSEYRSHLVQSLYGALLGRQPAPSEISALLAALAGGATDEEIIAIIVGSAEYFHLHGDSNALFLNALYEDLLGRPIDPDSLAFFERFLESGRSRGEVALAILGSAEYRAMLVERYSWSYLLRRPTAVEIAGFLALFAKGTTDEQIIAIIVGSEEYFVNLAPTLQDLCKDKGWRKFAQPPFRNQGQCVREFSAR
jgi:Domain of unknown function (DUF4214)